MSVLPDVANSDPPEENKLVPYSESNYRANNGGRDPTMYVEDDSKAEDPDGVKVDRKKSKFAADAILDDRANRSKKKKRR